MNGNHNAIDFKSYKVEFIQNYIAYNNNSVIQIVTCGLLYLFLFLIIKCTVPDAVVVCDSIFVYQIITQRNMYSGVCMMNFGDSPGSVSKYPRGYTLVYLMCYIF